MAAILQKGQHVLITGDLFYSNPTKIQIFAFQRYFLLLKTQLVGISIFQHSCSTSLPTWTSKVLSSLEWKGDLKELTARKARSVKPLQKGEKLLNSWSVVTTGEEKLSPAFLWAQLIGRNLTLIDYIPGFIYPTRKPCITFKSRHLPFFSPMSKKFANTA